MEWVYPIVLRMVKITISTMSLGTFCDSDTMIVILTLMPRFSARDLLMRYHWGLGVGHLHAHQPVTSDEPDQFEVCQDNPDLEPEGTSDVRIEDGDSDIYDSDDPEQGIEIGDLEEWEDVETSDSDDDGQHELQDTEDEDFTGM